MAATREDIFANFDVAHYRPKERPEAVRMVHWKTQEETWHPLFDDDGAPLYSELMAELDAIKRERIGGLMLRRDWGHQRPWPTWPKPDEIDLTHEPEGEGDHKNGWLARGTDLHVIQPRRVHRGGGFRSD